MAEVKWIKITTDIFDDEKILLIESLPEADSIIVIWFKLLCLAGKQNNSGVFVMGNSIPYTDKMLATIFRRKEATVKMALQTFEQFGMVEMIDNVITIPNWGKHQSLEQIEARKEYQREYQREYRRKQKLLADSGEKDDKHSRKHLREHNVNTLEEDKKETRSDIRVSNDTLCQTQSVRRVVDAWNSLENFGIKRISKLSNTSKRYANTSARLKEYGLEKVLEAIERIKSSDYLQGKNKSGWMVTFDWFVLPNNFPKVLEGNYDNRAALSTDYATVRTTGFKTSNPFLEMLEEESGKHG